MRILFTLLSLVFLSACTVENGQQETTVAGPGAAMETWRLVIRLPQADLPVTLKLATDRTSAWFENGVEKVIVPDVEQSGQQLRLHFPSFNNTFDLVLDGDRMRGELTLVKRGYEQVMPVQGDRGATYRFAPEPQAAADVTGRWDVLFLDDEGNETRAVAELDQQGSRVAGTVLTPTGDYRYLYGEVDGRRLELSTFDGAHAFVFAAEVEESGQLSGDFWSGTRWHESWTAQRNFDARLPDPYQLTYLKEGYDSLAFEFPDLEGQPVALVDPKYDGKVVLVTLSGTWCPNCADEVAFLSDYYRNNHQRGLEIITLLYEHFEDFDRAAAQGRALRKQYGIDYDVLIAGVSDKTLASETLPMLSRVLAFPTMIFIDRDGRVRHIHTGFAGPGTGQHYSDFVAGFNATMDELLAEPEG